MEKLWFVVTARIVFVFIDFVLTKNNWKQSISKKLLDVLKSCIIIKRLGTRLWESVLYNLPQRELNYWHKHFSHCSWNIFRKSNNKFKYHLHEIYHFLPGHLITFTIILFSYSVIVNKERKTFANIFSYYRLRELFKKLAIKSSSNAMTSFEN